MGGVYHYIPIFRIETAVRYSFWALDSDDRRYRKTWLLAGNTPFGAEFLKYS
jgi:hypothetical protein